MTLNIQQVMDLTPEFYELNANQRFTFPHNNCDVYTNTQLESIIFGPEHLVAYLTKRLDVPDGVTALRKDPTFVLLAVSYMRLKFVLEVWDPVRIRQKLAQHPKCPKASWMADGVMDAQMWALDCLTTRVFDSMIRYIHSYKTKITLYIALNPAFMSELENMNRYIQTLRSSRRDYNEYDWSDRNVFELTNRYFIHYIDYFETLVVRPLVRHWTADASASYLSSLSLHTASPAQ